MPKRSVEGSRPSENTESDHCGHAHCLNGVHFDHYFCYLVSDFTHLEVSVLGICRQLYEVARHMLWKTYTFVFDEPYSISVFVSGLTRGT